MSAPAPQVQEAMRGASWRTRMAAAGVVAGSGFLLARTIILMTGGALRTYAGWAAALLGVEFVVDAATVVASGVWFVTRQVHHRTLALRGVAVMILVHALRVLVFVLGRTGPWVNFDVRAQHRAEYATTWRWSDVWLAGTGAALSLVVLAVVWRRRHRTPT